MQNAISSASTAIPKSLHLYKIEKGGEYQASSSLNFTSNAMVMTSQFPQVITFFMFFALTKGTSEMKKNVSSSFIFSDVLVSSKEVTK